MDSQKLLSLFSGLLLLSLLSVGKDYKAEAMTESHHHHHHNHSRAGEFFHFKPEKLFVFGDSYVDTGNTNTSDSSSWKYPYGISFPGIPSGRFSDGRLLSDFIAKFVGLKSPVPYQWRNVVNSKRLKYGMNFAYGGTGVFDTWVSYPNMTNQIVLLQNLINSSVYNITDIQSSVALVSLAGNDYTYFQILNSDPSLQEWQTFITSVVNQLSINLKRIKELGVKKILVTGLEPSGCVPSVTVSSSYQQCNESSNSLASFHNTLLQQAVAGINNQTSNSTFILDLYDSFLSVIDSNKFEEALKPCCAGVSSEYSCGSVDENGEKKYTLCEDPETTFFWDSVHPTQAGWRAVYSTLLQTYLARS